MDDTLEKLKKIKEMIKGIPTDNVGSNNFKSSCPVCGISFTDSLGRPIAMGYCCINNKCPSKITFA